MRLYPEKLVGHLQQQLLPVYLVSGDEPLLVQECCDQIRRKAREQGCNERVVIDCGGATFNWQEILHSAASMTQAGRAANDAPRAPVDWTLMSLPFIVVA